MKAFMVAATYMLLLGEQILWQIDLINTVTSGRSLIREQLMDFEAGKWGYSSS